MGHGVLPSPIHDLSGEVFLRLRAYVGLDEEDERLLREVGELIRPHRDRIVNAFYDRIVTTPETRRVLQGPEHVERLKRTLAQWLEEVFSGPHDRGYGERRLRIGGAHVRAGVPQAFVFAAMAHIRQEIGCVLAEGWRADPRRAARAREAVDKVLDLDLALIAGSYHEALRLAELRRELAFIDMVLETAPALVFVLDEGGRFVRFNRACEQATGFGRDEVRGRTLESLVAPEERTVLGALPRQGQGPQGPAAFEADWITRDGSRRRISWALSPLADGESGTPFFVGTGKDVTEQQRLARALVERESLARLGEMAAVVAHEVKNPLAAIFGAVQVLMARLPPGSAEMEAARQAIERIRALDAVVKDLLTYGRPQRPVLRRVHLKRLAADTVALLTRDLREAQVRVEIEGPDAEVMVDPSMIQGVVLNILVNAAQAMGHRGTIAVRLEPQSDHVRVMVADQGPGMPPEVRARAFEPFFTTKTHGTGLGLPIARRLVHMHGGDIEIDCPATGGTAVTIRLPRCGCTG